MAGNGSEKVETQEGEQSKNSTTDSKAPEPEEKSDPGNGDDVMEGQKENTEQVNPANEDKRQEGQNGGEQAEEQNVSNPREEKQEVKEASEASNTSNDKQTVEEQPKDMPMEDSKVKPIQSH